MRRSEKSVQAEPAPVAEPEPAPAPVAEDPEIEETPIPVQETAEAPAHAVEEFEETVGEDTVAEFESGYATTELDEESYDEELQEEAPRPARARRQRAALTEDTQADSMDRLLNEANDKLEDPATSRRRTTLAHLRAAVAATRAEKSAGTYEGDKDQSGAYREDLADVMRPRREAPVAAPEVEAEDDAAPLRLVASQRVDAAPAATEEAVRPRRVSPADISSFEPKEDSDFAEYAEEVGATELPDILEAAASYLTYVEGRRRFSRPMLMRLAYQVGPDRFQREAGLRSFGQLLRDKKIEKIAGGRFTVAETIGFKPESARRVKHQSDVIKKMAALLSGLFLSFGVVSIRVCLSDPQKDRLKRQDPRNPESDIDRQLHQKHHRALTQPTNHSGRQHGCQNDVNRQADHQNKDRPSPAGFVAECHQSANGSVTRMVSSRSGLVDKRATGQSISSSTRFTYLIALAGRSFQLRAPSVLSDQPGISS